MRQVYRLWLLPDSFGIFLEFDQGGDAAQTQSNISSSVSVQRTHLPSSSFKDDGVRVFLSGRDRHYRQDFNAPTKPLSETIQRRGRPGMPATWSEDFQRSHPSRHQRQRDPQVATDVPGSNTHNSTSLRPRTLFTQARNGRDGQGCAYAVADTDGH